MIILLGTSHISPESIKNIKKAINEEKPDCVAVELDPMRFRALTSRQGTNPPGLFLKIFSWLQKELGKMTGISPGAEMMSAVRLSRKHKLATYLIDQNFAITVRDLQKISLAEKLKLFFTMILGCFGSRKIDLKKVPPKKVVEEAIFYLEKHFPQLHRILLVKRNIYMAAAIRELAKKT